MFKHCLILCFSPKKARSASVLRWSAYVLYIPNMPEAQPPAASKKVKPKLITANDIEDPDNDA